MEKKLLTVLFTIIVAFTTLTSFAQNINYSANCIATKMKHDCDNIGNEEGRFSVQISDNLNFSTWYRAGNGTGDLNKCLICDGDANATNGCTCNWNILLVSKTDVNVSSLRMSFRASEDDGVGTTDDWWMDDDCTYTHTAQDVTIASLTAGQNNDIVVGQSTDPQWYVTYRFYYTWVAVNVPPTPVAHSNPSCGATHLESIASTQTGVTWYWQGTNSNGTLTSSPSTSNYTIDTTGTYYLRAKGNTNNVWSTASASVYIEVKTGSTAGSGINVTNNNTPHGTIKTISVTGGTLGSGAVWNWYSEPACINFVSSGSFIEVDPPSTQAYYVRAEGDCDTTLTVSTTVVVSASGIETIELGGGKISFFPNPAREKLIIEGIPPDYQTYVIIRNLQNQEIIHQNLCSFYNEISLSDLAVGIYLIEFRSGSLQVFRKLIKQ